LRISGERECPVPHLALPEPDRHYLPKEATEVASVALFADRASASRPDFRITPENVDAVVEIVNRLDGLPLAIELAASRVKLLPPQAIAQRLRDGSGFALLEAGRRDLPARQQTLRAAVDWSYQLLDEPARLVYQRLSVFMGGADLEQVEAVCGGADGGDVLGKLGVLVDHSLVREEGMGGEPRFRMLETIRQYAADQLAAGGEEPGVRRRHALAFLDLAEAAAPHLIAWDQKRWLDRLELDHDNLRAALTWSVGQGEANLAMQLGFAMWRFWQVRGHLIEAEDRFRRVLAVPGGDPLIRAKALEGAGGIHWWRGQTEACESAYRESLELVEAHGDLGSIANARYNLALAVNFSAGSGESIKMLHRARAEAMEAGDERLVAWTTWGLSDASVFADRPSDTEHYAEEALALFRKLDDPFGIGWSTFMAAFGAIGSGLTDQARPLLLDGIRLFAGFSDISALTLHLNALGMSEVQAGRTQRAARLLAAARRLRDVSGTGMLDLNETMLAEFTSMPGLEEAQALLTDEAHVRAIEEGLAMSQEEAIAYALGDEG
jgi:predicted ATPase